MAKKLRIHLTNKKGMYTVTNYNKNYIHLSTNNHKPNFIVPCRDFLMFAGGINYTDKETEEKFLSVISPIKFKTRIIQEERSKVNEYFLELTKAWEDKYEGIKNKAELMEKLYRASLEEIEILNGKCSKDTEHEFEKHWDTFIQYLLYAKKMGFPLKFLH